MKSIKHLLWLFCAALLISACSRSAINPFKGVSPEFGKYVSAYSGGLVSCAEPIRVCFTENLASTAEVGNEVEAGLFEISPAIPGKLIWENERTIAFKPDTLLPHKTAYSVHVKLNKLFNDVPSKLEDFAFGLETREQFLTVDTDGLLIGDLSNWNAYTLVGTITTADYANDKQLEQAVTSTQDGNSGIKMTWEHSADGTKHNFKAEGILRGSSASKVRLAWSGTALEATNSTGMEEFEVPATGDFKVLSAKEGYNETTVVTFSDPLSTTQDLNGLVKWDGSDVVATSLRVNANQLLVFLTGRSDKKIMLTVANVKNANDVVLPAAFEKELNFMDESPHVKLLGDGVIIPDNKGLMFPFEAVNLNAVDVEIFKIFDNNVMQFLQDNNIDGNGYSLDRVGRVVLQKRILLKDINPAAESGKKMRYALDLAEFINQDKGAIYQVRIGFRKSYAVYPCAASEKEDNAGNEDHINTNEDGDIVSIFNSYGDYYYDDYSERSNPCNKSYYNSSRFVRRNVIASNLGIIAKRGGDKMLFVATSDLLTTEALGGTEIKVYDAQNQIIQAGKTGSDGSVLLACERQPHLLVAEYDGQKGYLRLEDGFSLSLSKFQTDGTNDDKGIKGKLYGERGVWRPGDSLYLTFVVEDKLSKLPMRHPVTLELYNPNYQLFTREVNNAPVGNMYAFRLATPPNAPTGDWAVHIKVGASTFYETVKIETVKPNRFKMLLDFGGKKEVALNDGMMDGSLQVNWLYGAPAKATRANITMSLESEKTAFDGFKGFEFDDPARNFNFAQMTIFDGITDDNGSAKVSLDLKNKSFNSPGKLRAHFGVRAFEKSGDISSTAFSLPFSPYNNYVGISIPEDRTGDKRLSPDAISPLSIVCLDKYGKPAANRKLSVGLYRVEWRWWWDASDDNISTFSSAKHYGAIEKSYVTTDANGRATWKVKPSKGGRYMVRVVDEAGGHSTGDFFTSGFPWQEDDMGKQKEGATLLNFSASKTKYKVGETVELNIPAGGTGRILVSLENGHRQVKHFFVPAEKGMNTVSFTAEPEMAPNIYASVTLLQPHNNTKNDLPIRQYGVVPVMVEDPATKLEPVLDMPNELAPEKTFSIKVSEKASKSMDYTLAIVDDGLLDLTQFKTPDLWEHFYQKEALGVKTWDMYDDVLGVYGGQLEKVLAIGGDGAYGRGRDREAQRFKPVVRYFGPYHLDKGRSKTHQITLPNYVGSVRTMVVATNPSGGYGSTEKTCAVKKDLMIFATLPRVLGIGESVKLPVDVFTTTDRIKNVNISVQVDGQLIKLQGNASQSMNFTKMGNQMTTFDLAVNGVGMSKVVVTAQGGGETMRSEINIEIRNPNPLVSDVQEKILQKGESIELDSRIVGTNGTNKATLEVSNIPPINLSERLRYLIEYPHGCIEQTTSGAMPQLVLAQLTDLDATQKAEIDKNIKAALNKLKSFQTSYGGFGYWEGDSEPSYWGTSYAGQFMLEAQAKGYVLPVGVLDKWVKYQQAVSRSWTAATTAYENDDLMQAYRLYTLALAKQPELGAMNRLREKANLTNNAAWRLAAAYALVGKPEVSQQLITNRPTEVKPYRELAFTYGSDLRDLSLIVETLTLMNDRARAYGVLNNVAKALNAQQWLSTQETAVALMAVGKFVGNSSPNGQYSFVYQISGEGEKNISVTHAVSRVDLRADSGAKHLKIRNNSNTILFVRVVSQGQPSIGTEKAAAKDLVLNVNFKTLTGEAIDVAKLPQGTDFVAEVSLKNPGIRGNYDEMALTQIFPSGWEIHNARLFGTLGGDNSGDGMAQASQAATPEYQDLRDDRALTYFDLPAGQTRIYRLQLNAAYLGKYYLPATSCEAMYDNAVYARKPGRWVEVVPTSAAIQ